MSKGIWRFGRTEWTCDETSIEKRGNTSMITVKSTVDLDKHRALLAVLRADLETGEPCALSVSGLPDHEALATEWHETPIDWRYSRLDVTFRCVEKKDKPAPAPNPFALASSLPAGAFAGERKRWEEYENLKARGAMYGLTLIPGEHPEALRRRIEEYLAGGIQATFNGVPFPCRPRDPDGHRQHLGVALTSAKKGGVVEVAIPRAPSFTLAPGWKAPPVHSAHEQPTPSDTRTANRRLGEEIAKNPPEWAYPLAWRLAVMAVVEDRNNRDVPVLFLGDSSMRVMLGKYFGRYHRARLEGQVIEYAIEYAFAWETAASDDIKAWLTPACRAYERGRPGPGGCKVGRPA